MPDEFSLQAKMAAIDKYTASDLLTFAISHPDLFQSVYRKFLEAAACKKTRPRAAQERTESAPAPGGPPAEEERLQALQAAREGVYGDTATNMRTLGAAWSALIEAHYRIKLPHPLPPHVAALILTTLKTVRMCGPAYHKDNYDDARNFLRFAEECDERKP